MVLQHLDEKVRCIGRCECAVGPRHIELLTRTGDRSAHTCNLGSTDGRIRGQSCGVCSKRSGLIDHI